MGAATVGPRVDRYQTSAAEPDRATALTVELMCRQIERSAGDPTVRAAARDAVARFRGGPVFASSRADAARNCRAIAESVWWWAKHFLRFAHHDGMIRVWFGETDQLQLLISPDLLLRMADPRGDCAVFTTLISAMLRASGVDYEIVTLAVDPHQPDVYSHVFPRAVLPDGRRLALDASHGTFAGWEVPRAHQIRRQVWNSNGVPIGDADRGRFRGLHGYVAHPRRPLMPRLLTALPGGMTGYARLNRGLGQIDLGYTAPVDTSLAPPYYLAAPSTTVVSVPAPSTGGFNVGQTIGNLLSAWTQIGSRVIAPTTTVSSGPSGTQVVTPAGAPLPAGAVITPGIAGASTGGLVLLGLGVFAVILMVRAAGGRQ